MRRIALFALLLTACGSEGRLPNDPAFGPRPGFEQSPLCGNTFVYEIEEHDIPAKLDELTRTCPPGVGPNFPKAWGLKRRVRIDWIPGTNGRRIQMTDGDQIIEADSSEGVPCGYSYVNGIGGDLEESAWGYLSFRAQGGSANYVVHREGYDPCLMLADISFVPVTR